MKAQMKFQKILPIVTLVVAALVFVYSLCLFSGNLGVLVADYKSDPTVVDPTGTAQYYGADKFLATAQAFVDHMITICIVFFVVIAISFILGNNKRRNYYITNYVAVGLVVAMSVFVAIYGLANVIILMNKFKTDIDWESGAMETFRKKYEVAGKPFGRFQEAPSQSTLNFALGIPVFIIVLLTAVAWGLNLLWKIKLMQGEKALLENGLEREVA